MKDAEVEIAFSAMEALDDFSIDAFRSDIASLTKDDILCFDLNFPVTEILQLMDHTDAQIYLEATSAHKIEKLRKYNWQAAGLKLNLLEAEILTGSSDYETVLEELEQLEVKTIILTLGPEGVMVFKDRIWSHYQDQHPWKSINDSGIGDAFMAGYLAGLMRNEDPVLNAFTMSYLVAQSPQATRPDLTLKMMLKERKSHHVNVIRRRPRRP
jgi:sugar/nucleoside kinase (ribokinase family)